MLKNLRIVHRVDYSDNWASIALRGLSNADKPQQTGHLSTVRTGLYGLANVSAVYRRRWC